VGLALYLLPKLTGQPLYSHRLALWGLWSVWTGEHHQLYSPAPDWLEYLTVVFSILALVPTTAFLVNFFMTMRGSWRRVKDDIALRFLATGAIFWGLTCLQGEAQSFRSFSLVVHLTNWVVGHSHLAFVADYTFWAFALIYLMQPSLLRRPGMYSRKLMEWHYWLVTAGIVLFMMSLWIAGVIQGIDWLNTNIPFITTVNAMNPFFLGRLVGGVMVAAGVLVFVFNVWMTARLPRALAGQPLPAVSVVPSESTSA
jgi:cbb3-type cytochrome c oxidase subunit I